MKIFLIAGIFLFSVSELKSQPLASCDYHISFYEWNYELGWRYEKVKSSDHSDQAKDSVVQQLKDCPSQIPEFIIEYPLRKNFDSAELVIIDKNGNKLNVAGFELLVFRPRQEGKQIQNVGGKLNASGVAELNSSGHKDQYIITKITAYDIELKKEIQIPSMQLRCK